MRPESHPFEGSDPQRRGRLGELARELRDFGRYLKAYRLEIGVTTIASSVIVVAPDHYGTSSWMSALLYFGAVPLVGARLLGLSFRELGLGLGEFRTWAPLTAALIAVMLPLLYLGSTLSQIEQFYSERSFDPWISLATVTLYMIGWEFLFRGFLLFGLKRRFGELSIVLQVVPFTVAHLNKPPAEALSCVVSGLLWGYICYRGNSFWPAVILHVVVNYVSQALVSLR